uniref:Uncharacterized protein n=1 Tax=Rhizophora mucronata TaxID=61149 RepID=A0A2P2J0D3_RHIMU
MSFLMKPRSSVQAVENTRLACAVLAHISNTNLATIEYNTSNHALGLWAAIHRLHDCWVDSMQPEDVRQSGVDKSNEKNMPPSVFPNIGSPNDCQHEKFSGSYLNDSECIKK